MTPKEFRRYLERDGGCLHCGEQEAVAPQHRINRGMGGSQERHKPANIIVLCSAMNQAVEQSSKAAALAKQYGWKLETWQQPAEVPVYDALSGCWYLLDNQFGRKVLNK